MRIKHFLGNLIHKILKLNSDSFPNYNLLKIKDLRYILGPLVLRGGGNVKRMLLVINHKVYSFLIVAIYY
jgi:hypothetical protein